MAVGTRIAELRRARGWTQAMLAERSDISPSAISMYETNRRSPDEAALSRLADALTVSVDALLTTAGQPLVDPVMVQATERRTDVQAVKVAAPRPPRDSSTQLSETATWLVDDPSAPRPLTTFALSTEEARIILFLRMNPTCRPFVESYIMADTRRREQFERTLRLIQDFQS